MCAHAQRRHILYCCHGDDASCWITRRHVNWQSAKAHMSEHFRSEPCFFQLIKIRNIGLVGDKEPGNLVKNIGTFAINGITATAQRWKIQFLSHLWAPIAQKMWHRPGYNCIYTKQMFNGYQGLFKWASIHIFDIHNLMSRVTPIFSH